MMQIIERIKVLAQAEGAGSVFGSRHHRWAFTPPWPEERILEFEQIHGGTLPKGYRHWIGQIGAGGVGPGNGLFEPGTFDVGRGPQSCKRRFGPLGKSFPYGTESDGHRGKLPGAIPIAEIGCGTLILLVTGGEQAGRIWVDDRANGDGLRPEDGLDFQGWIRMWLDAVERETRDPWKPLSGHANEPDKIIAAEDILEANRLAVWASDIRNSLENTQLVQVDQLGHFRLRGSSLSFVQSDGLRKAREPDEVPGEGVPSEVFREAFRRSPWVAIEVPGLFVTWVAERQAVEGLDYLGRPYTVSRYRRFLVVRACMS